MKSKATKGLFWSSIENFSIQFVQLATNIVLARLLMPSDFGIIGMLNIFLAISQTFIYSGLGTALIQKKRPSSIDFSTVFVYNLTLSVVIYAILFIGAPLISSFYSMPSLTTLTRVLMLNIIINSLGLVQTVRLTINLDFKKLAQVNILSVVGSGVIAIFLAYMGFGVWSLVLQNLLRVAFSIVGLWLINKWEMSFAFSKKSFKELFGFGSKLLGASVIATFFDNIYRITIGKFYSSGDLGYFSQAKQFTDTTSGTVSTILQKVTFPILAAVQDDKKRMISIYSQIIGMISFIILPVMVLLALLAEPFIRFFLTDKWLPAVPLLQWLCFARVTVPISSLNMNVLNAVGRSDLFLKNDIIKIPILLVTLVITVPLGLRAIVIGNTINSFILFFINAYMPGKLFSFGPVAQLKQMFDKLISTGVMALLVYWILQFIEKPFLKLVIGSCGGIIIYFGISSIIRVKEVKDIMNLLSANKLIKWKKTGR